MSIPVGWYEIHIVGYASGDEHGVTNEPIPPSIGDKINLHFQPGNVVKVVDREFDYTKGLYVTLKVAFI